MKSDILEEIEDYPDDF